MRANNLNMEESKKKSLLGIWVLYVLITVSLICSAAPVFAAPRYAAGVEGVEAGSVPPPGFHYRFYYVNANNDELKDNNGNESPIGFDLDVAAYVNRFVYITDIKLFGGDYGMNVVVPITNIDMNTSFGNEDSSGLGDICIEPFLLAWHKPVYDAAIGVAIIAPTGKYDKDRGVNNGEGFWSTQLTLGGTWFFDEHKSLSASVLTRTIYNFENNDTNEQKGMEFTTEWGIGKTIPMKNLLVRPGICGFGQWDISDHDGTANDDLHYRKYAVGAEINLFWLPPTLVQGNFRVLHEFGTRNGPEGSQVVFTLTKSF